jgi:serine/threonine-protein kinase
MTPGEKLTPSLTLVRCLAEGGMGSVWVAQHETLRTEVAVKLMSPVAMEDASLLERFRREAMAAAQVRSLHIAQVFDHGVTESGRPYIVMELLEGEDLQQCLERVGKLDPLEVVEIVHQVAKALTQVHSAGIVHRDIKSSNIFLQQIDGALHVKVLDFGVAKIPVKKGNDMSVTGLVVGTPFYMSPEQLRNSKHVDARSDLWSLAVVAYQALTATFPFPGRTVPELIASVTVGKFAPPSPLRGDVSPEVDAWFVRAFERDPAARFASAKEMSDAFEKAVTGECAPRSRAAPSARLPPHKAERKYSATDATLPDVPAKGLDAAVEEGSTVGIGAAPAVPEVAMRGDGRRGGFISWRTTSAILFIALGVVAVIWLLR